jgi:hypothetical protein
MKSSALAAIAAIVCASALGGCATIVQGTTESVSVTTTPDQGAQCTLKNSEGTWYVTSPGSTTVHKTKNDLTVSCKKDGYPGGEALARSHFGGTTAGNVLAGGLIGIGIDAASGANYYYDSPITVDLGKAVAANAAAPAPAAAASAAGAAAAPAAAPTTAAPAAAPASK